MNVQFEKKLVEEAVFSFFEREKREGRFESYLKFREKWNAVYAVSDEFDREKRFAQLAADSFQACGLDQKVFAMVDSFPHLRARAKTLLVRHAYRRTEEGADLFSKGGEFSVVIRVGLERFLDENKWEGWVRENLLRIEDVLDPAFGYQPADFSAAKMGPRAVVVEERYRLLWLENVRSRVKNPAAPRATHAQLLARARAVGLKEGESPGSRDCPLCRFPTRDWAENVPLAVVASMKTDFPHWKETAGVCRRCSEIYEAKVKGFYVPLPGATQPA